MQYKTLEVDGQHIRYLSLGDSSTKPPVVFFNGFGVSPSAYAPLLRKLSRHHRVIAPAIGGMSYLETPPATVDDCVELAQQFVQAHSIEQEHPYSIGHSLGGTVALLSNTDHRVGINPLFTIDYGSFGFARKALYKSMMQLLGKEGEKGRVFAMTIGLPFAWNVGRKPRASIQLVRDICAFNHERHCEQYSSGDIVYGTPDRFFPEIDRDHDAVVKIEGGHDCPATNPDGVFEKLEKILNS